MDKSDYVSTSTICAEKLESGERCQNRVRPGKGPCWRHANGLWRKVRSFAQNETKKFVLTTAIGILAVAAAFYGGSHIARTTGPNSPAVNGNGTVINYGPTPPRPWLAIKDPTLVNTVELSDRGFDAWVRVPLENTSDTPAVAAVGASLFFITDHHPKPGIDSAQDKLCQGIQDRMVSDNIVTSTVFRGGEPYPMTIGVHAGRAEADEAIRLTTLNFVPAGSEAEIDPVVISCVVYRGAAGKDYYSSAYANLVERLLCKTPTDASCSAGAMLAKKRKYNATELVFPPSFESGTRAK